MRLNAGRALRSAALVAAAFTIAGLFAFRDGVPGLRHDWIWPSDPSIFSRWLISGFSAWQSGGYGASNPGATVNLVLLFFAVLAWFGAGTKIILWLFFAACLICAHRSSALLVRQVSGLEAWPAWFLGFAFAYSPVFFQKAVAGHVYYLAAYAVLPLFMYAVYRIDADSRNALWWTALAATVMCVAAAQLQFLVFFSFVWLVIALSLLPRRAVLVYGVPVLAIVVAHVAGLFSGHGAAGLATLSYNHGTRQWEIDLSDRVSRLIVLGGYLHYDSDALPKNLIALYGAARWFLFAMGVAGIAVAMARKRRRTAIATLCIGITALFVAAGYYGPFRPLLNAAMLSSEFFTVMRELYHVMALYMVALVMLAGIAIAALSRRYQTAAAAVAALVALPFISNGLSRMVPAVAPSAFFPETCRAQSIAPLPQWEPVASKAGDASGLDPVSLSPNVLNLSDAPLAVRAALDRAPLSRDILGAMGIRCISWRPDVVTRLPSSFEPNTGADFRDFVERQAALRLALRRNIVIADARPLLSVESATAKNPIDETLPDAFLPPGEPAAFTSSYDNNDIRRSWVSTRLWAWYSPGLSYVSDDAVITRSAAPLTISLPASGGRYLYLLVSGSNPIVDGDQGIVTSVIPQSPYRWVQWKIGRRATVHLALPHGGALAAAISSTEANWRRPSYAGPKVWKRIDYAEGAQSFSGILPNIVKGQRLVLLQKFDPGWRLSVNGKVFSSERTHGIFNGWLLGAIPGGTPYRLFFEPAKSIAFANIVGNIPLVLALLWLLVTPIRNMLVVETRKLEQVA